MDSCIFQNTSQDVDNAYKTPASLGKARRRVMNALPISPRKRVAVVRSLASNVLRIKLNAPRAIPPHAITEETVELVKQFYGMDSVSRIMPGKADTICVKIDGKKFKERKRHLVMTVAETWEQFKTQYPDVKVGLSKFASLRPKHILLSSQTPQNVCGCIYHSNMILLLESLHRKVPSIPLYSREALMELCVCDMDSEECMINSCENCKDGTLFRSNIERLVSEDVMDNPFTYLKWIEGEDGYIIKDTQNETVLGALQNLEDSLPQFQYHVFIKQEQQISYQNHKLESQNKDSQLAMLQVDFAENFTTLFQDEIQSAHWRQHQVSIFTIKIYYGDEIISRIIASDCRDHDKVSVSAYMKTTLDYIATKMPELKKLVIWSDGPSSQFKNKFIFILINLLQGLYSFDIEWHFTATGHGKGANDALGGDAKSMVHARVMSGQYIVNNAKDFVDVIKACSQKIEATVMTEQEIITVCDSLGVRNLWDEAKKKSYPGTLNTHCVSSDGMGKLVRRRYTRSLEEIAVIVPTRAQSVPGNSGQIITEPLQLANPEFTDNETSDMRHADNVDSSDTTQKDTQKDTRKTRNTRLVSKRKQEKPKKQQKSKRHVEASTSKKGNRGSGGVSKVNYYCPGCDEIYIEPLTEDWIQCCKCRDWWHEACTGYEGGFFSCDFCEQQ